VAKHLLQLGVRSPKDNARWTAATLRGVLTNPVYTGHVYVGRRRARPPRRRRSATHALGKPARGYDFTAPADWTLVATVPALISQELFAQVQAKLALNKKQAVRNNKAHHYLLRALVSCGLCQSACLSRTTPQGHSYYMCRCSVQPLYSQRDRRCHARFSPAQQLDILVWQDLCE
jgi:site-specific DNA recombinase